MDRSTRQLLEHRVETTRNQVTALSKEFQAIGAKLAAAIREHTEATRALRAVQAEEIVPEDSITAMVNRFLTQQSQLVQLPNESPTPMVNRLDTRRAGVRPGTIKADVVEILKEHPRGLIALDILKFLNSKRNVPLRRTSLSPQLSRLAQAGHIKRRGSLWFIPSHNDAKEGPQ